MGKNSLTKSTTSKKNAGSRKKTSGSGAAKNTKADNQGTKKTSKKPSLKTLRNKKFETWQPEKPYRPEHDPADDKKFTAPELTGDYKAEEAERIRALLLRKIDLNEPEPDTSKAQKAEKGSPQNTGAEEKASGPDKTAEKSGSEQAAGDSGTGGGGGLGGEPPGPPAGPPGGDDSALPLSKGMLGAIIAVVLIFAVLIGASVKNMDNFYIKQTGSALEIWRGDFSPSGREKIAALPGAEAPKPLKEEYSKQEAHTLAFEYYMEKARTAAETKQLPDLNTVRNHLDKAKKYAVTGKQKETVNKHLNRIEFLTLLYKADLAAEKQTRQGYKTALDSLKKARELGTSQENQQMVKQRITRVRENLEKLQEKPGNKGGSK